MCFFKPNINQSNLFFVFSFSTQRKELETSRLNRMESNIDSSNNNNKNNNNMVTTGYWRKPKEIYWKKESPESNFDFQSYQHFYFLLLSPILANKFFCWVWVSNEMFHTIKGLRKRKIIVQKNIIWKVFTVIAFFLFFYNYIYLYII